MPDSARLLIETTGNEIEEKIITFMTKNIKVKRSDLEKLLNLKERRIRDLLTELQRKGKIKKIDLCIYSVYNTFEVKPWEQTLKTSSVC